VVGSILGSILLCGCIAVVCPCCKKQTKRDDKQNGETVNTTLEGIQTHTHTHIQPLTDISSTPYNSNNNNNDNSVHSSHAPYIWENDESEWKGY
jgi:hypothetical protein